MAICRRTSMRMVQFLQAPRVFFGLQSNALLQATNLFFEHSNLDLRRDTVHSVLPTGGLSRFSIYFRILSESSKSLLFLAVSNLSCRSANGPLCFGSLHSFHP